MTSVAGFGNTIGLEELSGPCSMAFTFPDAGCSNPWVKKALVELPMVNVIGWPRVEVKEALPTEA